MVKQKESEYQKAYGYSIWGRCPVTKEEVEIHGCLKCTDRNKCGAEWVKE